MSNLYLVTDIFFFSDFAYFSCQLKPLPYSVKITDVLHTVLKSCSVSQVLKRSSWNISRKLTVQRKPALSTVCANWVNCHWHIPVWVFFNIAYAETFSILGLIDGHIMYIRKLFWTFANQSCTCCTARAWRSEADIRKQRTRDFYLCVIYCRIIFPWPLNSNK